MSSLTETRYAKTSDGVHIAHQMVGEGTVDRVFVMGWTTNIEAMWDEPDFARFLTRLASFARLILSDERGVGPSDRVPPDRLPTLETRMDDVRAVLDAAGSERAVVFGVSEGGPMSMLCVLTTVLFTDIVGSPERAAELGDHRWKELLGSHHERVRGQLARYHGHEVDTAGDGFLATFDGPARAIRCAQAMVDAVRESGIEIRAGVHSGEVELLDSKVSGIALHVGARVASLAGPSEILVSQTVKDLVAGSGLAFEDAGEHELKGVPDRWRLYRVVD